MYRTAMLSVVSCGIEISGVPKRILRYTETETFKTHKTGTNGMPVSGRCPIRDPVGKQAIPTAVFRGLPQFVKATLGILP
jgi:hypothetical protein